MARWGGLFIGDQVGWDGSPLPRRVVVSPGGNGFGIYIVLQGGAYRPP